MTPSPAIRRVGGRPSISPGRSVSTNGEDPVVTTVPAGTWMPTVTAPAHESDHGEPSVGTGDERSHDTDRVGHRDGQTRHRRLARIVPAVPSRSTNTNPATAPCGWKPTGARVVRPSAPATTTVPAGQSRRSAPCPRIGDVDRHGAVDETGEQEVPGGTGDHPVLDAEGVDGGDQDVGPAPVAGRGFHPVAVEVGEDPTPQGSRSARTRWPQR